MIEHIDCAERYGYDIDNIPISLLTKCMQNPKLLDELPPTLSREYYYEVKNNRDKYEDWYYSAIMLFGSYNSRVYGGCYGATANTKDGKVRNYFSESINNFRKQITRLQGIRFEVKDYQYTDTKGALIYCDPPYADSIKYSQAFDNDKFWDWVRKMSQDNIVVVSEYNAPDDFECIWSKQLTVHIRTTKKNLATEKLFIYKGDNKWQKMYNGLG